MQPPPPNPTPPPPGEAAWLRAYDPRDYPPIAVTVDIAVLTLRDRRLHVLLVRRGAHPYLDHWALPGGFVRAGAESPDDAAARELAEETGLDPDAAPLNRAHLEQLAAYGDPARDPRVHVISLAYLAFAPDLPDPRAGTDAADAAWIPVDALDGLGPLAFDHAEILRDALERARTKLEQTPLATAFLPDEFTVAELRGVYEAVWNTELHAANFHRKALSAPGFVDDTGRTTERGGTRGGRRARLYRAGPARTLHPPLLRQPDTA